MRLERAGDVEAFGARLADGLRVGDVVALHGDLGAGKTTLARGLLRRLGHVGEVPSPTFAIVQGYQPPELRLPVAHVDLYRLDGPDEVAALGLDEWLEDGALVVEWPDHLPDRLRRDALELHLQIAANDARLLTADVPEAWEARWPLQ